jgi:Tfp pilus assembly protein PilO
LKIDLGQLESDKNVLESEHEQLKDDKLIAENQLVDLNQLRQRVNELENIVEEDKDELDRKNEEVAKLEKDLLDSEKL